MSVLAADNLTVQLGTWSALTRVTFAVEPGDFVTVLGPNGAGKSTLIRAALNLVPVTSGSLLVLGKHPGEVDPAELGYVPQIKTLDRRFPALPIELVVSGLRGSWPWRIRPHEQERAMKALKTTGMAAKWDRPIGQLSGGELQRVYLARAIVHSPKLIFLDEPATGMDAVGEADMYHMLEHYRDDHAATIVMVTHDWEVARHHASRVLLLNREMSGFGPPSEVLSGKRLRTTFGHVGHEHPMMGGE